MVGKCIFHNAIEMQLRVGEEVLKIPFERVRWRLSATSTSIWGDVITVLVPDIATSF